MVRALHSNRCVCFQCALRDVLLGQVQRVKENLRSVNSDDVF